MAQSKAKNSDASLSKFQIWLLAIRPKTLPAAAAPVLIGTAMAFSDGVFHALSALVALLGALLIQIGTNLTNDYADFFKGADTEARKGPVRVTQSGLLTPEAVRNAAILSFGLAFCIGLYLVYRGGLPILWLGIASILCGVFYTVGRYSLAYLGIADLFVFVFFGPVAVGGTYFVQALSLTPAVLLAGIAPGLLSVAILVVNNRRDMIEDAAANKRTLVVRFGRTFGNTLHFLCIVLTLFVPSFLVAATSGHFFVFLTFLVILPAIPVIRAMNTDDGAALNPQLGATARLLVMYALLFAIGWNI